MATVDSFSSVAPDAAWGSALALSAAVVYAGPLASAALPSSSVGSGGVASLESALMRYRWSDSSGNVSVRMAERVSADQQLVYVRDVLAISITDLAELLGVARPTIYAWMQGAAAPRDEHLLRLQQVEQQAREVEAFGLLMEAKLLKRPLRDGTTLLQRLNQRQPLAPALTELAELNRMERQQRASRKGHALGRTAAEAVADQSTPGFLTEA